MSSPCLTFLQFLPPLVLFLLILSLFLLAVVLSCLSFSSLLLLFILFRSHLVSHTCLISSHLVCPSCLYYFLSRLSSSCLLLLISTISFLISSFLFHFLSHMFNSHQASHPFLSSSPCFNSCLVLSLVFSSYLFFSSYLVSHAYLSTSSFRFLILTFSSLTTSHLAFSLPFFLYFLVFYPKLVFCLSVSFHNFFFSYHQPFLSSHIKKKCQRKSHFYWSDQSMIAQNPL